MCVELCSLHVQPDGSRDALVSQALFGDGAAALVVGRETASRPALARLGRGASRVDPDGGEHMAWEIGDHGFLILVGSLGTAGGTYLGFFVAGLLGAPA